MGLCIQRKQIQKQKHDIIKQNKSVQTYPQIEFSADIRQLHKNYIKIVLYVRDTKLFADRNEKLINAVHKYFAQHFQFDKQDLDIASVDVVRKLHPKDYWFKNIDQQWLINACLRQQKFSDETKVQKIKYQFAYKQYLDFLKLCKYNIEQKNGAIAVPCKCQDVIWHSHMQDPQKYKSDMIKYMGTLLNHMDDIPDDQLRMHSKNTQNLKRIMNQKTNKSLQNNQIEIKNSTIK